MKDARYWTRSRLLLAAIVGLLTVGLAACEGDDGDDGRDGADGADGPAGPAGLACWDLNENGVPDPEEDLNGDGVVDVLDCNALANPPPDGGDGVDISNPDVLDQVDGFVAEITGIEVSSPPVITFTLTTDSGAPVTGLGGVEDNNVRGTFAKLVPPGEGFPSRWESYINRIEEAGSGDTPDVLDQSVQATNDGGAGTLTELGGGEYTYEYAIDVTDVTEPVEVTYEEGLTHQAGLEIRLANSDGVDLDPVNPTITFVPDGSDPLDTKFIASEMTCNNCHVDLAIHGGHRKATNYCVTCHNPGSIDQDTGESVDMAYMAHSIHVGEARGVAGFPYTIYGFRDSRHNYGECVEDEESGEEVCTGVVHPQDVRNCSNCHEDSEATPDGDDWLVNSSASACGGCHIEGLIVQARDDFTGQPTYQFQHFGGSFIAEDGSCATCHVEGGPAGATAEFHRIFAYEQAEKFRYNIQKVFNTAPGQRPRINFTITDPTNGNARYDIFEAGGPWDVAEFGGDTRLAIDIGWNSTDFFNAETGSEATNPTPPGSPANRPGSPAQVISINPLADGETTDLGNNLYQVKSPVPVPDWVTGSLGIGIEGHPAVLDDDGNVVEVPATGAFAYFAVTDGAPVERRQVVSIEKCNACHEKLSLHGFNRTDNIDLCTSCHNANATDIRARQEAIEGTFGNSLPEDAKHEESIDFKRMVHQIHAGNVILYGFGGSEHDYTHVDYPTSVGNCGVCHEGDSYYPVDEAEVLATTIYSDPTMTEGRTPERAAALADQGDDLNTTANTAVCTSCHMSDFAVGHMEQNGGVVADMGSGLATQDPMTGELNSGTIETCALCHAEGGVADTGEAHGQK